MKESEVTQSCLTLCGRMDCSPPGSSVRRISKARIQEWVAVDLPDPGIKPASPESPALQVDSLPAEPLVKPQRLTMGRNLMKTTV